MHAENEAARCGAYSCHAQPFSQKVMRAAMCAQVDGFRFDIMGHLMVPTMAKIQAALAALTLEADSVDGQGIYVYGEAWDFGEVRVLEIDVFQELEPSSSTKDCSNM